MLKKFCWGLALGLCGTVFVLQTSPNQTFPILAYFAFYIYAIGLVFGAEKIIGWFNKTGGVSGNASFFLLFSMLFRNNGCLWGMILFIFYVSLVAGIGCWYGIGLACVELYRYFFRRDRAEVRQDNSVVKICLTFLVLAICGVTWAYWPQLTLRSSTLRALHAQQQQQKRSVAPMPEKNAPFTSDGKLKNHIIQPVTPAPQNLEKRNLPSQTIKTPAQTEFAPIAMTDLPKFTGSWRGSYTASQGRTGLTLIVKEKLGKPYCVFTFYPTKENPNVGSGQYEMNIYYNKNTGDYYLKGQKWLKNPNNYQFVDLKGKIDSNTFSGHVIINNSMTTFTFSVSKRLSKQR